MDSFFSFASEHAFWATLMVLFVCNAVRGIVVGLARVARGVPAIQVVTKDGKVSQVRSGR